jgi:peptide/nickel transport system permease protein
MPDTLYRVFSYHRREKLVKMALASGEWAPVAAYEQQLSACVRALEAVPDSLLVRNEVNVLLQALINRSNIDDCRNDLDSLHQKALNTTALSSIDACKTALSAIPTRNGWGHPVFYWYGLNNQYHDWLTGKYASESSSPWKRTRYSMSVSLFINLTALVLALLLGILTGMWTTRLPQRKERVSSRVLILIYVVPVLLIACVLRYLFATPGHGLFSSWIGGVGPGIYDSERISFMAWVVANKGKLLLPIIALAIHFTALIALQMRTGMVAILKHDYIRTARAKGLSETAVYWRHAFPNALSPVITVMGMILPAAVSGAIVVEAVFNINGLGYTIIEAIQTGNYPVMMSIVMLAAVLTVVGSLLADICLAWLDPRIREGFGH